MGAVADAVLAAVGVIPRFLEEKELAHRGLTDLVVVETMHQRKATMADLADAFVALSGGFGTADELFEILTWSQLGMHSKPVGLLNVGGFFDALPTWLDHCVCEGFIRPQHRELLLKSTDSYELIEMLIRHKPKPETSKWIDASGR
jgi:uncharacterized protein (TIGR00730 family)